jgi:hypothetical protein
MARLRPAAGKRSRALLARGVGDWGSGWPPASDYYPGIAQAVALQSPPPLETPTLMNL